MRGPLLILALLLLLVGWTGAAPRADLEVIGLEARTLEGTLLPDGAQIARGQPFRIKVTVVNHGPLSSLPAQVYYTLCSAAHPVIKAASSIPALAPGQKIVREFETRLDSDTGTWVLEGNVDTSLRHDREHYNNHIGLYHLHVQGESRPTPSPTETPTGTLLPTQRRLYAADNVSGQIFIYDIDDGHKLVKLVDLKDAEGKPLIGFIEGLACHAPSRRLFLSDSEGEQIIAYDLLTDQPAWVKRFPAPAGHKSWHLDRLTCSADGKFLYVPCRGADWVLVLDASNGELIKKFRVPGNPHNGFTGEKGRYVYAEARSSRDLTVIDPRTQTIAATIKGFSSPLRPFCVTPDERFALAQTERKLGFVVADLRGDDPRRFHRLLEIEHPRPARLPPDACSPHRGHPEGHGIAIRPNSTEVWFLDDHYGLMYIYDYSPLPQAPRHIGTVKLFQDYSRQWTDTTYRWLTFSADGRFCYAPNGWVIDAVRRRDTGMRYVPGEKALEIDFVDGVPVRNGGQNGGVYR